MRSNTIMQKKFRMSQKKYDELRAELEYMKTVREKEVADQVKEARSFGDLSENSEYDEAKNEQGKLYSKIAEMKDQGAEALVLYIHWGVEYQTKPNAYQQRLADLLIQNGADIILGDTDILCQAPLKLMISGLGDMLAKYVSITEWRKLAIVRYILIVERFF